VRRLGRFATGGIKLSGGPAVQALPEVL